MKKIYVITIKDKPYTDILLHELNAWGVNKSKYKIEDNILTTQDNNVIDVVTETFLFHSEIYTVEVKKGTAGVLEYYGRTILKHQ